MRRLFTLFIFMIALGAGLYTQRVEVLEWYRGVTAPELPEAVEYEDIDQISVIPTPSKVEWEGSPSEEVSEVAPGFPAEPDLASPGSLGESVEANEEDESFDLLVPSDPSDLFVLSVEEPTTENSAQEEATLPVSMNLAVPFTSQAPQGNWDEPYQEACEEASVYMVHAYFTGIDEGKIPAETADHDLLKIVEFEMELYGFYKDTTVEQTGMFAELMYGHTYQVLRDPTVEDIQRKLVQGHPIIVPAAGRLLGNQYFTAPGPLYHMLVIRGYTEDGQFIVNDPGTYRGEAYLYDFDTIMNALHDWNDGGEITEGKKVVLVLSP